MTTYYTIKVISGQSGQPIRGAEVDFWEESGSGTQWAAQYTDSDGMASVYSNSSFLGTVYAHVTCDGYSDGEIVVYGYTNPYNYNEVWLDEESAEEEAWIEVTITSGTLTYNGSPKILATVTDGYGTFYMGFGSSPSVGPSSYQETSSLSATNAGTYYIWAYAEGHGGGTEDEYYGSITINKAQQTDLFVIPSSYTLYNTSGYNRVRLSMRNGCGQATYSTSNSQIASIDIIPSIVNDCDVYYGSPGTAYIYCTCIGNENIAQCTVVCTITCAVDTVKSLSASTGTSSISYNGTTTITVSATYESGFSTDVTTSASYSTSPTGIVTIS